MVVETSISIAAAGARRLWSSSPVSVTLGTSFPVIQRRVAETTRVFTYSRERGELNAMGAVDENDSGDVVHPQQPRNPFGHRPLTTPATEVTSTLGSTESTIARTTHCARTVRTVRRRECTQRVPDNASLIMLDSTPRRGIEVPFLAHPNARDAMSESRRPIPRADDTECRPIGPVCRDRGRGS